MFLTADVSTSHANGHVVYNYVVQKKVSYFENNLSNKSVSRKDNKYVSNM